MDIGGLRQFVARRSKSDLSCPHPTRQEPASRVKSASWVEWELAEACTART